MRSLGFLLLYLVIHCNAQYENELFKNQSYIYIITEVSNLTDMYCVDFNPKSDSNKIEIEVELKLLLNELNKLYEQYNICIDEVKSYLKQTLYTLIDVLDDEEKYHNYLNLYNKSINKNNYCNYLKQLFLNTYDELLNIYKN